MRRVAIALGLTLMAGSAQATSNLRIDGTIVDPILTVSGSVHTYLGADLEPYYRGSYADLSFASLIDANLLGAEWGCFSDANNPIQVCPDLSHADLSGANLYGAYGLGHIIGPVYYDSSTNLSCSRSGGPSSDCMPENFDIVAAGWMPVSEPSTALLLGFELVGLAATR